MYIRLHIYSTIGMTNLWWVGSLLLVLCMVSTDTKDTNFGSMLYAIFCSIFRSLSSVSSAVHSPVTGPVETHSLLLCGVWVGVLAGENIEKVRGEVLKDR